MIEHQKPIRHITVNEALDMSHPAPMWGCLRTLDRWSIRCTLPDAHYVMARQDGEPMYLGSLDACEEVLAVLSVHNFRVMSDLIKEETNGCN